jgi:hypothetical protein
MVVLAVIAGLLCSLVHKIVQPIAEPQRIVEQGALYP